MRPKPAHLRPEYGAQFQDAAVVAAYPHRPPYPEEVFTRLQELLVGPSIVLDIGCGTGDIARRLAPLVERLDAVDISAPMIAAGKSLPSGDAPNLHWQVGALEDAPLDPPYGLIVAGESLHWMEWSVVMPRLRGALAPGARLALVGRAEVPAPWTEEFFALIRRSSTNRDFQPYDLIEELTSRGLYEVEGGAQTEPVRFNQSIDVYIESIHSRNGFSRDRMTPADVAAFDAAARALIAPHAPDGMVTLHIRAELRWGQPQHGDSSGSVG
ncbi:MAG TPA: class I SAM-dependent methyltransferase [Ktedonobacterales bacterium]